jgi:hypothetical protein
MLHVKTTPEFVEYILYTVKQMPLWFFFTISTVFNLKDTTKAFLEDTQ